MLLQPAQQKGPKRIQEDANLIMKQNPMTLIITLQNKLQVAP